MRRGARRLKCVPFSVPSPLMLPRTVPTPATRRRASVGMLNQEKKKSSVLEQNAAKRRAQRMAARKARAEEAKSYGKTCLEAQSVSFKIEQDYEKRLHRSSPSGPPGCASP